MKIFIIFIKNLYSINLTIGQWKARYLAYLLYAVICGEHEMKMKGGDRFLSFSIQNGWSLEMSVLC